MNIWFDLYWTFFCIGGLTFGGGYAMLPMLEREIVERHHWSTSEELLDYYAVGQCTPGIIAVNVATIIGYQQKGLRGAAPQHLWCGFSLADHHFNHRRAFKEYLPI